MYRIFLCGPREDRTAAKLLKTLLSRYGTVCYEGVSYGSGERNFLLEEGEDWPDQGTGLLLFKKSFREMGKCSASGWIALLESGFAAGLRALYGTGIPTALYGTSPRDTFSVSSSDFPCGSVSMLRGVTTLSGEFLEPEEIPIYMEHPLCPEQMVLLCAVLVLCGVPFVQGYRL